MDLEKGGEEKLVVEAGAASQDSTEKKPVILRNVIARILRGYFVTDIAQSFRIYITLQSKENATTHEQMQYMNIKFRVHS